MPHPFHLDVYVQNVVARGDAPKGQGGRRPPSVHGHASPPQLRCLQPKERLQESAPTMSAQKWSSSSDDDDHNSSRCIPTPWVSSSSQPPPPPDDRVPATQPVSLPPGFSRTLPRMPTARLMAPVGLLVLLLIQVSAAGGRLISSRSSLGICDPHVVLIQECWLRTLLARGMWSAYRSGLVSSLTVPSRPAKLRRAPQQRYLCARLLVHTVSGPLLAQVFFVGR